MAEIYSVKNRAQVDAVRAHLVEREGQSWANLFDVMIMSTGGELSSLISLEVEHVKLFLTTGVIVWNMNSKRSLKITQSICSDMRRVLTNQIKIADGRRYLFEASVMTVSNRSKNMAKPISRSTVFEKFKDAQESVRSASMDAGITEKVNVTPQSIVGMGINAKSLSIKLSELVVKFGAALSESFMDEARREIGRLNSLE